MALIKTSAIIDSISGKLNGSVFSKNRAGAYLRGKGTIRFKPGTELSDAVNSMSRGSTRARVVSVFSDMASRWRTISTPAMLAWNSITSEFQKTNVFGDTRTPSGFNLYVGINSTRLALNTIALTPEEDVSLDKTPQKYNGRFVGFILWDFELFEDAYYDWMADGMSITIQDWGAALSSNDAILIEASAPMSAGITAPSANAYRAIVVDNISAPKEGETDLKISFEDQYNALFGSLKGKGGQKVFLRVSSVSIIDGQKGEPNYFSMIVPSALPSGD